MTLTVFSFIRETSCKAGRRMKACQFWQQDIGAVYVIGVYTGQVSGSAAFTVYPCKLERPQSGTGHAVSRTEQIEDLRCPIMSAKTIIRLRCSSLRNTFEVGRRGAEPWWKLSTKSERRRRLPVVESSFVHLFKYFIWIFLLYVAVLEAVVTLQLKILPKKNDDMISL